MQRSCRLQPQCVTTSHRFSKPSASITRSTPRLQQARRLLRFRPVASTATGTATSSDGFERNKNESQRARDRRMSRCAWLSSLGMGDSGWENQQRKAERWGTFATGKGCCSSREEFGAVFACLASVFVRLWHTSRIFAARKPTVCFSRYVV